MCSVFRNIMDLSVSVNKPLGANNNNNKKNNVWSPFGYAVDAERQLSKHTKGLSVASDPTGRVRTEAGNVTLQEGLLKPASTSP